jgi:hypothetical protein
MGTNGRREYPRNSLESWEIENFQVARFYNVSPQEVTYEWSNVDFLKAQEFMWVQYYVDGFLE